MTPRVLRKQSTPSFLADQIAPLHPGATWIGRNKELHSHIGCERQDSCNCQWYEHDAGSPCELCLPSDAKRHLLACIDCVLQKTQAGAVA